MICPAILDPFQGANYRLSACIHQALLCPIISKMLAYLFSSSSLSPNTIEIGLSKSEEILQRPVKINRELLLTNANDTHFVNTQRVEIPSESSNMRSNVNNHTKSMEYSEKIKNFSDGKQMKNACDIGNSAPGENLHLCMNGGNKKMQ